MQATLKHKDYLSRHIRFILVELLALWKEEYFSDTRAFKKAKRYWMRVIANYSESLRYYLFGTPSVSSALGDFPIPSSMDEAVEILKRYGVTRLPDVDTSKLPFVIFNQSNARSSDQHKVNQDAAFAFAVDNGFHQIATQYLKEKESYFLAKAWRLNANPTHKVAVRNAMWHRDRDGFKVIKFFVYLSDVIQDDGEHEYAPGTHKMKPLRFVPQIRFSDAEVTARYHTIKIKGKRGYSFVEDTTGLHKASLPVNSNRDIICLAYFTGPIFWEAHTRKISLP